MKSFLELGYGFNEKVYQNALTIALQEAGFKTESQKLIQIYFRGQIVGEYFADIVVDNVILLELKAAKQILDDHESQLLNYGSTVSNGKAHLHVMLNAAFQA